MKSRFLVLVIVLGLVSVPALGDGVPPGDYIIMGMTPAGPLSGILSWDGDTSGSGTFPTGFTGTLLSDSVFQYTGSDPITFITSGGILTSFTIHPTSSSFPIISLDFLKDTYSRQLQFNTSSGNFTHPIIPEPATLSLLGIGLLAGAAFRKRFK